MRDGARSSVAKWTARLMLLLLFTAIPGLGTIANAAPAPSIAQPKQSAQETTTPVVNIELILDSSGSMDQDVGGGESRMEAAKRVLKDVIAAIPENPGINVGFRLYGYKGNNTESGKD